MSGNADVSIGGEVQERIHGGISFGESALLGDIPRQFTVITKSVCEVVALSKDAFTDIQIDHNKLLNEQAITFLSNVPILRDLRSFSEFNFMLLMETVKLERFDKDHVICKEGDPGDEIYVIKRGKVNCVKNGQTVRILNMNDYFGEKALLSDTQTFRSLDCVVESKDCELYSFTKIAVEKAFGSNMRNILFQNMIRYVFKDKETKFQQVKEDYVIDKITESVDFVTLEEKELFYDKDKDQNDYIIIMLQGKVGIEDEKDSEYNAGYVFGQELLTQTLQMAVSQEQWEDSEITVAKFEHNIVALEKCHVARIKATSLFDIIFSHREIRKDHNFKIKFLKKIGLLSMVGMEKLTNLCSYMNFSKLTKGEYIFRKGDEAKELYII